MTKISLALRQQLTTSPNQSVNLIVRTQTDATPYLEWFATAGLQVKRQFKLSPGVAISCLGGDALKLLEQDWVKTVELDRPVSIS